MPTIYNSTWTLDASGNWSNAGDWATQVPYTYGNPPMQGVTIEPVVPGADDAVNLSPSGSSPFTVTFNTTDEVYSLGGNSNATLAVQGGALTIDQGGLFGGAVTMTGGSVDLANGWSVTGGYNQAAGSVVQVDAGTLAISTGTLDGTIGGGGELYLIGGDSFTLQADVAITTGTLELGVNGDGFGSTTTLAGNFSYTGDFLLDNYSGNDAVFALNGFNATIAGTSTLDAEISGPGTITVRGTSTVAEGGYSGLTVADGAVLVDAGTMTQYQNAAFDSVLRVNAGAVWDIVDDGQISNLGSAAIKNAGLFEKTGGTAISYIAANITNSGTLANTSAGTLWFSGTLANTGTMTGNAMLVTGAVTTSGSIDLTLLTLRGGGTIGGHLTGTGELDLTYGASYGITAGTVLNMATLGILDGSTQVTVHSNETLTGALTLTSGTLDLQSYRFTVAGAAALSGGAAGGTGKLSLSDAAISNNFVMFGSSTLIDAGTVTQNGYAQLGGSSTDTVTLSIGATDTYDITGAYWLGNPNVNDTGTSTIDSAGLFEMTGASGYATVFHSDFTSSGTLLVNGGGLSLSGGDAALSGTIEGTGSLYLGLSWTLGPKQSLTIASLENGGVGTLEAATTSFAQAFTNDNGASLDLNGHRLVLTGAASLAGLIGGSGTLTVSNATDGNLSVYGDATLVDAGLVTQNSGSVDLGNGSTDQVTLVVQAHATYDIIVGGWLGNPNVNDTGVSTIDNAGLFEMTGTGTAYVWHSDFTNTGTLRSNSVLALVGQTASLGGKLTGTGALVLDTAWTLESGVVVSVASLENGGGGNLTGAFSYAGGFTNDNGATIDLHGHALTLTGAATLQGAIGDGGTLTVGNATDGNLTVYGDATLVDTGLVTQNSGSVDLGDGSSDQVKLVVQSGATYDISVGGWLGNPNVNDTGTSTIDNTGLFENTSAATADVWHSVFTSSGTLSSNGVLALVGPTATLSGTLGGSGDIDLATTWTLAAGSVVTVGTFENAGAGTLLGNATFHGGLADDDGSTLALGTYGLTVDGAATLDGSISGAGTLTLNTDVASVGGSAAITVATLRLLGAASLSLGGNFSYGASFIDNAAASTSTIDMDGHTMVLSGVSTLTATTKGGTVMGGGTFENTGSLTQAGKLTLGDTTGAATLTNAAAGTWDVTTDVKLAMSGTGSAIDNAGLFEKTLGSGLAVVAAPFTNTGTVEVTSGTIEFTGGFVNSGSIVGTLSTSGGHTFIAASHI